jgi:quercetin dioxygenase-like cupin family protein
MVLALGVLAWVLLPRFMICLPAALRVVAQTGCWMTARRELGVPPGGKLYWHIDRFADRAAAEAARGPSGTVVESYGKVWLFSIAPDGLAPTPGERVAVIGPLPIDPDTKYTADYMEGTFSPGMRSIAHRHPGPEAFYNLEGEFCLETPGKKTVVGPGRSVLVDGGTPMQLTATGTVIRRSLVLILHPSSRLPGTPTFGWKPEGLCRAS